MSQLVVMTMIRCQTINVFNKNILFLYLYIYIYIQFKRDKKKHYKNNLWKWDFDGSHAA